MAYFTENNKSETLPACPMGTRHRAGSGVGGVCCPGPKEEHDLAVSTGEKGVRLMAIRDKRTLVAITQDARRVIRDIRGRVGLSRRVLEQRAKLGKGYVKDVELGRTQSAEAARLTRLLQVVQREATRGAVPTKVMAGGARPLKRGGEAGRGRAAKR